MIVSQLVGTAGAVPAQVHHFVVYHFFYLKSVQFWTDFLRP